MYVNTLLHDQLPQCDAMHIQSHSADLASYILEESTDNNALDETIPTNNNTVPCTSIPVPLQHLTRILQLPDRLTIHKCIIFC